MTLWIVSLAQMIGMIGWPPLHFSIFIAPVSQILLPKEIFGEDFSGPLVPRRTSPSSTTPMIRRSRPPEFIPDDE